MSEEKVKTPEKKTVQTLKPADPNAPLPKITFAERIRNVEDGLQALCEKYHVKRVNSMDFPQYKIFPEEVQLALLILQNHRGNFVVRYEDLDNPNGEKTAEEAQRSS